MTRNLILIIFIASNLISLSQNLNFKNYSVKDGLISNEVYNMHQDRMGYIWFFTNYGVMKYNGKNFYKSLTNIPLNESFIYSCYENKNGELWIANSNARIYTVKNDSAFFIKGLEPISSYLKKNVSEIFCLGVDDSLNISVFTKKYSFQFIKNKNYKVLNLSKLLANKQSEYMVKSQDSILYPINVLFPQPYVNSHYLVLDTIKIQIEKFGDKTDLYKLPSRVLSGPKIFKYYKENVVFTFHDRLIMLAKNNETREIKFKSLLTNFSTDKRGHIWVGTVYNGLYEVDGSFRIVNHYFENQTVNSVLVDSFDGIWVSTSGKGLYHCSDIYKYKISYPEGINLPIKFVKKIDGDLAVGNIQGDVFLINKLKHNYFFNSPKDAYHEPMDIVKFNSKYIVSYRDKIEILNIINNKLEKLVTPKNKNYSSVYKFIVKNTDTLIALHRNSLSVYDRKFHLKEIGLSAKINVADVFRNEIYIGTDEGLRKVDFIADKKSRFTDVLNGKVITNIIPYNDSILWLCTKGNGIIKFNYKVGFKEINVNSGLPSNIVYDICIVNKEEIFIATNIGVYRGDEKTNFWVKVYDDEVKNIEFYNGNLYLGTADGLFSLNTINKKRVYKSYINLSKLIVNGLDKNIVQNLVLEYRENNLEFKIDHITEPNSGAGVAVELFGKSKFKDLIDDDKFTISNIEPGKYTLLIKPKEANVYARPLVYRFEIREAYWNKLWFKILLVFIISVIIFFIYKILIYYTKKREFKKYETKRLILEYKLIALQAQVNPHFISNCLSAIQHLIISNKSDEASIYLADFSLLLRKVLNFSSKHLISLKEELDIIKLNVSLEQLRFDNGFNYEEILNCGEDLNNLQIPPMLLQPIVENAIWHGLLPIKNERKGALIIIVKTIDNKLIINIEDNGVGRSNFNIKINKDKQSKGIEITKQRLLNLKDIAVGVLPEFIVEDLYSDSSEPIGTRVILILPIIKNYDE